MRAFIMLPDGTAVHEEPRTRIEQRGQRFVDEPVWHTIAEPTAIAQAVRLALQLPALEDLRVITHYRRINMRWLGD